jgi:hypothetical protein
MMIVGYDHNILGHFTAITKEAELREKFDEWCPGFNAQSEGQARAA